MGSKSDYLENKVLDHALGTATFSKPSTVYLALYSVAPTDAGGGTELAGNAYARTAVTFAAASGGSATNSADALFPVATADWSSAVAFGLFDASTSGNLLYWGSMSSVTIAANDQLKIPAGGLVISED